MAIIIPQYDDTTKDLLLAVLVALGGNMAEVKNLYVDTKDDLLHAILERLSSGKVPIMIDSYNVAATIGVRSTINRPAIIGATSVLIAIGGMFIDSIVTDTRYYLANLVTGDIDMPPVVAGELVVIFKF